MTTHLEALLGILALGAPFIVVLVILMITERRDGTTRFVIRDGRVHRRSRVNH